MNDKQKPKRPMTAYTTSNNRIDLENYIPDYNKHDILKRRLFDSGISTVPMPSVRRPIETKIASRPFSAKMNSNKIQHSSPLKKKFHDLNANIIGNLNEEYKQAAIVEAKYEGEGTQEYYKSQHIIVPQSTKARPSTAGRKLQGRMGVSIGQPRMTGQLKRPMSSRPGGLAIETDFGAGLGVRNSGVMMNRTGTTKANFMDPNRILTGPPNMTYAGFAGTPSISQKNLEQARSRYLLDKLTGKLPSEFRLSTATKTPKASMLPTVAGLTASQTHTQSQNSQFRRRGGKTTPRGGKQTPPVVPGSGRRGSQIGSTQNTERENMSIRGNEFPQSNLSRGPDGSGRNLLNTRRESGRRQSQKLGSGTQASQMASASILKKEEKIVVKSDIVTDLTAENTKKPKKAQKWSDLDKYIELLLDSKSEEETVFVYLIPNNDYDPYDLKVVEYSDRANCEKYYTLSSKGLTTYVNEKPVEFHSLGQWLIERDSYNHIKELAFFKQFKSWKFMRMWKKTIKHQNRLTATNSLEENLFILQDHFSEHLAKHRVLMLNMSRCKFVDCCETQEPKTIEQFAKAQADKRDKMSNSIVQSSTKSRRNISECIDKVLTELRQRILGEITLEEKRKTTNPQPGNPTAQTMKRKDTNNTYDKLGFPAGMTYAHRSSLRKECTRFLRFAYLVDFLSLEALTHIYIGSLEVMIERLDDLNDNADMEKIMTMQFDDNTGAGTALRGHEPLFYTKVTLDDSEVIPENEIVRVIIGDFLLPPRGKSEDHEFDLLTHIEIEKVKDEMGSSDDEYGVEVGDVYVVKERITAPNIQKYWIKLLPNQDEFSRLVIQIFAQGLVSIKCFERWSKHQELQNYADALEDWDDLVGEDWNEPESPYLDPCAWIADHKVQITHEDKVRDMINSSYDKANDFLVRFQPLLEIYWRNKQFDINILINENTRNQVEMFANTLRLLKYYQGHFKANLPSITDIGLVQLDSNKIKANLLPTPKELQESIEKLVPAVNKDRTDEVKKWLQQSIRDLQKDVRDVSDFVQQKQDHERISEKFQVMRDKIDLYGQFYAVLAELGANKIKKEDKINHLEAEQNIKKLTDIVASVESKQETENDRFKSDLQLMIPVLREEVKTMSEEVSHPKYLDEKSDIPTMIEELDERLEIFKTYEETGLKYNDWQEHLGTPQTVFEDIDQLREDLTNRHLMWHALSEWQELKETYEKTLFTEIDDAEISKQADKYGKTANRLEKTLPENPIQQTLKELVETFKGAMPIVTALRNQYLQEEHWDDINELIEGEISIKDDDTFTLKNLIDLDVVQYMEEIQAISVRATGEFKLKKQWSEINEGWKQVNFTVITYKDTEGLYVLADVDDIYTFLDENLAQVNMILGNRYAGVIRDKANKTKHELNTLNNAVDEWITLQQEWMYLESIFKSGDIKKTLQSESVMFDQVDKFFRNHMGKVFKSPKAQGIIKTTPNIVENFAAQNATLEHIRRKITAFLETRRESFPRFYFLSDEELLKILANSNDLEIVQGYLKALFDGVYRLTVDDLQNILEMKSKEGEVVPFHRPVKSTSTTNVEIWLMKVQDEMKATLAKSLKDGNKEYVGTLQKPPLPRKEWVLVHPAQIVTTVAQIQWCFNTEESISMMMDEPASLQHWYDQNSRQLEELTQLVRGELSELKRAIIVALITQDVHARDIVEKLKNENTQSIYDFDWQQQLRYYYEDEVSAGENPCTIKQIQATLQYGYEYMGATSRLVITPLTDKCWITITGALHIKLGANPAGPAGTGKTESTKDLAKGIATFCVVFNCSEQIDYKQMQKLFSGLIQQGCWTCLDEFNRIDVEVLSVIAQQLLTIRKALQANAEDFEFEGSNIKCKQEFGCHITMNPGYAGRTELPDNLKVLFRPVAMMIPSYGLIAEVMLFGEGFGESSILSKKMVQLYKLSSEQLSQQDHYDFGMRAVKSVLVMAGDLKRAHPDQNEDAVLIRAMKDANVPKFLKDDLPLFQAIVQDLFPSVQIEETDYSFLLNKIMKCLAVKQLQPHPPFMQKVIQLFETFNVRFGVMLVGYTGSGKTTCYQTLADVMTSLRKEKHPNRNFQVVHSTVLNPKAISMGELYGEVDLITQEWTDGLASRYMRSDSEKTDDDKCWTIFDGPVDSLWIENMNTVLDDNMTLCLSNGQRLKLRNQMRMLFEVQDLSEAAPSTVSRCGMVYLTAEELGWRPYVQSWIMKTFPGDIPLNEELKAYLWDTFDQTIDIGLEKMRSGLNEPIPTNDLQLVKSICNFLTVLIKVDKGFKAEVKDEKQKQKDLICVFAFAYTHGMGASLDEKSKDYFDTRVRDTFKAAQYPTGHSVFEYFYDARRNHEFVNWETKLQNFSYQKEAKFFELMVDTATTFRHSWCLEVLLEGSKSAFFTGESGVGKSVIIQNTFNRLSEKDLNPIYLNFSAQTDSKRTQQSIQEKLEKITRTTLGAPAGKRNAVFVDDINMPFVERYGAQPPIELLRLFMDRHGLYDRAEWSWKTVTDTTLVAAAAPPVGGRYPLTPRFTTNFNMFCVPEATQTVLQKIFGSILGGFLKAGFQDNIQNLCDAAVNSTIEVYEKISSELRATPAKFHYLFNLRDVSKVVQGIMMTRPVSIATADQMAKLWVNEACRVFQDRLIDKQDKDWFVEQAMEMLSRNFKSGIAEEDLFGDRKLMFADIHKLDVPIRLYEEIKDQNKLIKSLNSYLEEYNYGSSNKMNLVFFEDAILHILRICRTLRQPRGNIMLIGVGGSGKQSLTRLSSHMYEMDFKQIEIIKGYNTKNFNEFTKELMFSCGISGKKVTFTMTDSQILSESFLEDINNILNTGEVPNLMMSEDKDKIQNECRQIVIDMKLEPSADIITQTFVSRVRENFHICLCMSPVGDELRLRCRQFPSIVNCCTLDWFTSWPEEALLFVSTSFLKELDLPQEFLRKELADMCKLVHTSVEQQSDKFFNELKRKVYTTPKSYLDLISVYLNTLEAKRKEYNSNKNRLSSGLTKLNLTNDNIAQLKIELADMQPILEEKNDQLKITLDQVQMDKIEADAKEAVVMEEKEEVEKKKDEASEIQADAENDVRMAQPELDKAKTAVEKLDKNDIVELKSFTQPPDAVKLTMEPVMLLLGNSKDWASAKKVMGDANKFLETLKSFDVANAKETLLNKIRKDYFSKADFNPQYIGERSKPAGALCTWIMALSNYQIVHKKIVPKKAKLAEVTKILNEAQAVLDEKLAKVAEVRAAVEELQSTAQQLVEDKEELEANMRISKSRMSRAEKLVVLLADEGVRWKETVEILSEEIINLVGDVFLSCACISYFGGFTGVYREELTEMWSQWAVEKAIPCTQPFSLIKVMGDPIEIKNWNMNYLPSDRVSLENGILATKAERWGLCIDPQQQANRWLKSMLKGKSLMLLNMNKDTLIRDITGCVRNGVPVLIEDLEEHLNPGIDPILNHQEFVGDGGIKQIKLGDSVVDYDNNFKLYMTSKQPNPHYPPEVCIKVTLINFTVTTQGLEEQLLGDVVVKEKPEVEAKRDEIVVQMDKDQRTLKKIENDILKLLNESEIEAILDADTLINVLDASKVTSSEINERLDDAKIVEEEITVTRNLYIPVAIRGQILYFVIADMAKINDMYQNSLQFVKVLFNKAIDESDPAEDLEERLENLINTITRNIFSNISRGLFEADKLIFTFLIASSVKRYDGIITPFGWNILLRGAQPLTKEQEKEKPENPLEKLLPKLSYDIVYSAQCMIDPFEGIIDDFKENAEDWESWATCEYPEHEELPGDWQETLTDFQKCILLKCFRPEKIMFAFKDYVKNHMGKFFVEGQAITMDMLVKDTDKYTPMIFILSTGADPMQNLLTYAQEKEMSDRIGIISLGQGQSQKALKCIDDSTTTGKWVVLQNCHLAKGFMPELEKKVGEFTEMENMHEDFRLFLTSDSVPFFPVSVLQNGIKSTTEPPRGLKANLKRSWAEITDAQLEDSKKPETWQKLVFGITFFHAIVQERRKFGPLGWNIVYEFNDSDLETSKTMLKIFLEEDEIPWDALVYVTGEINYGGRVTDDKDNRCLLTSLHKYYCEENLVDDYLYSDSGQYYAPPSGTADEFRQFIADLPDEEKPEVFGLHDNANIAYQRQESGLMLNKILSIQPRITGSKGAGMSPNEIVLDRSKKILEKVPEDLLRVNGLKDLFKTINNLLPSLTTVLLQEMEKFNRLLGVMRRTLIDLDKAIHGIILMSEELDSMFLSLQNGKVPPNWEVVAYPSLKPLASWFDDLVKRVEFMENWLTKGNPNSYWMSGMYFPQGFLTGCLQTHARQYRIAIDQLQFSFTIMEEEDPSEISERPVDGVYIYGLYMDGARYNREYKCIDEQLPAVLYDTVPMIHFQPIKDYAPNVDEYTCPLYKTGARAGVLSTTGQSTNFILSVEIPTSAEDDKPPSHWVRRAAAMLCQLND